VAGSEFLKATAHDIESDFRPVAFSAEMPEKKLMQFAGNNLLGEIRRSLIG
jgi:hypothetical protein